MAKEELHQAEIGVRYFPGGITSTCTRCLSVVRAGKFAIIFETKGRAYFVTEDPPILCCGEEKRSPRLFQTNEAAREWLSEVVREADKATQEMHLVGDVDYPDNPKIGLLLITLAMAPVVH